MKTWSKKIVFRLAGDTGLLAEFGNVIDPAVNRRVRAVAAQAAKAMPAGVIEIIPAYGTLLFIYDPVVTGPTALIRVIEKIHAHAVVKGQKPGRLVRIPVCYGGQYGPDIARVAASAGLDHDTVIQLHSQRKYRIYMVGFAPGFPFLGGLDKKLFTPRKNTPRASVPAGSVGIANDQTGIYPVKSPGGWQIIGRTPVRLFAPEKATPFCYEPGDSIQFVPVTDREYERIKQGEAC